MIQVRDVVKTFGPRAALAGVSLSVEAGEFVTLVGPNGAGKTTTLRLLSTSLRPTSGTARVNGVDVVKEPETVRAQIGFLSGNTGLYGRLTAREMVSYFGQLYGLSRREIAKRTDEIFSMLDMHAFADSRNEKLSTGMKQKVSIARSVVHDPPVMVFDEPTTGLDVMSSRTIVDFIRRCRDENKCVVFSTHIMSEAMRLCDRAAIIHQGKIYASGSVQEILARAGEDNLEDAFIKIVGA